jgi:hypothetical protein
MSGSSDWPGDETAETQGTGLPPAERQILVALAVVGHASLSADELAELGLTADVVPLLEDLERRGLIHLDDTRRYTVLRSVGDQLRRTDEAMATGDRLMSYFSTLARGGSLTPARVELDAPAILGLAEWAAQAGRFAGLLALVQTLQASFAVAQHTGQWLTLLDHARTSAHAMGDKQSEIWALEQMATATAAAGDPQTAQRFLREADELRRGPQAAPPPPPPRREETVVAPVVVPPPPPPPRDDRSGGGVPAWVIWTIGIIAAALAGVGLGFVLDNGNSTTNTTTAHLSVTLTKPGTTETTQETVTLPAQTVTSTETTTVTTTTTTTVTTTAAAIP